MEQDGIIQNIIDIISLGLLWLKRKNQLWVPLGTKDIFDDCAMQNSLFILFF